MSTKHFIGYGDLAEWARDVLTGTPVYVQAIATPGRPDKHGFSVDTHELLAQYIDLSGDVHYWRKLTGRVQCINGNPFHAEEQDKVAARTESAFEILKRWLTDERGADVRQAVIAMPTNLVLMTGNADAIMRYDKDSDRFVALAAQPSLRGAS